MKTASTFTGFVSAPRQICFRGQCIHEFRKGETNVIIRIIAETESSVMLI